MEHWKDVVGYEGLYEVSNWGNVRSLKYGRTGKPRLLKPAKAGNGYLFVGLHKDGERTQKLVHRLVAEAFLDNPYNLPQINHKDENPANNHCENIEYCSAKYNVNYGTRNQRDADSKSISIDQFALNGVFIRRWKSIMEASRQLGIDNSLICKCARGKNKTAGGFKWRYAQK